MPRAMCVHGYIGDAISHCLDCGAKRRSTAGGGFGESIRHPPKLPTKLPRVKYGSLELPKRLTMGVGECLLSGGHSIPRGGERCDRCLHILNDLACDCPECREAL
jgi:hypothetical protein